MEEDVAHDAPTAAARLAARLVEGLGHGYSDPGLDIGCIAHHTVVRIDLSVINLVVGNTGVVEVLAQRADGDTVAPDTGDVLGVDVIALVFDSIAVIAALVGEILKMDVVNVHGIESVRVLDPVLAVRGTGRGRIVQKVGKAQIATVHDIGRPERRVDILEVVDLDVAGVPEHESHRAAIFGIALFGLVPDVSVAKNASRPVPIDCEPVAAEDDGSNVVLEVDKVVTVVVGPVLDIRFQSPPAAPFDTDVMQHRVEFLADEIVLILGENDVPAVVANLKSAHQVGYVGHVVAMRVDGALMPDRILRDHAHVNGAIVPAGGAGIRTVRRTLAGLIAERSWEPRLVRDGNAGQRQQGERRR